MRRLGVSSAAAVLTYGVAAGKAPASATVLLAAAILVVAMFAAARDVAVGAVLVVTAVALVPVYWGRGVEGFGIALVPMTVGAAILLPGLLRDALPHLRIVPLDVAVGLYLLARGLAYVLNFTGGVGLASGFIIRTGSAYVTFRLASLLPRVRERVSTALVLTGGFLSILSLIERAQGSNPFFGVISGGYQAAAWERSEMRFRVIRVEASFGHPIPFGMFVALVLLLAAGWIVTSKGLVGRLALVLVVVVATYALLDTLSRGPVVIVALASAGWLWRERARVGKQGAFLLVTVVIGMAVFTPLVRTVAILAASSSGDSRAAQSAEYRYAVASVLVDPSQFSLLGRQTDGAGSRTEPTLARRSGLKSLDNEYAVAYVAGGALSLLLLLVVAFLCVRTASAPGLTTLDRAWMVTLSATLVSLATVALLTQYADIFWISVAFAATISQERRQVSGSGSLPATMVRAGPPVAVAR